MKLHSNTFDEDSPETTDATAIHMAAKYRQALKSLKALYRDSMPNYANALWFFKSSHFLCMLPLSTFLPNSSSGPDQLLNIHACVFTPLSFFLLRKMVRKCTGPT